MQICQMAVNVTEAEPVVKNETGKKSKKESFTNQDLPFPPGEFMVHLSQFRKIFKSRLLAWAVGKDNEDPFGINSNLQLPDIVATEWCFTFPDLEHVMDDKREKGIVIAVVSVVPTFDTCQNLVPTDRNSPFVVRPSFSPGSNNTYQLAQCNWQACPRRPQKKLQQQS